jgi:hypothetical protein
MKMYDHAFYNSRLPRKYSTGIVNQYVNTRTMRRIRKSGLHIFIIPLLLIPTLLFVIAEARSMPQNTVASNQQIPTTNTVITATPQPSLVPASTNTSATINTNASSVKINDGLEIGIGGGPGDVLSAPGTSGSAILSQ